MKSISCNTQDKESFEPISIKITFDSFTEIQEFYALFNHPGITDTVPHIDHKSIHESIAKQIPNKLPGQMKEYNAISASLNTRCKRIQK